MSDTIIHRRKLLKMGLGSAGVLVGANVSAQVCGLTPGQPEGPFYPVQDQADKDNDLTVIPGATGQAEGKVVIVTGQVTDQHCNPVEGAIVEIWQACKSGRYNHPGDSRNPNPLDPNFQYWGIETTDANGSYVFKTIVPGAYKARADWWRPPHIHFKVNKRGYRELVTQMYFAGEKYNDSDLILKDIDEAEKKRVIVEFQPDPDGGPDTGFFAINMQKIV